MNNIYRDNSIDDLRREIEARDKKIRAMSNENAIVLRKNKSLVKSRTIRSLSQATIVCACVAGAVATGNGWFIFLTFLAILG